MHVRGTYRDCKPKPQHDAPRGYISESTPGPHHVTGPIRVDVRVRDTALNPYLGPVHLKDRPIGYEEMMYGYGALLWLRLRVRGIARTIVGGGPCCGQGYG